ncbi:MAG: hypothetical protein K8R60_05330 [Burkholderiales bacterium]|nr:hypothetical protein [Burkholderiales bacterium]
MSIRLRIALICLLAAALPVQGVAAATMGGCPPGGRAAASGHHDSAAHSHPAMHSHEAADDHVAAPPHEAAHSHDTLDGGASSLSEDHGAATHGAASKCSVCAVCCVAAAPPRSVLVFEPFPSAEFFAPFMPSVAPVFLTGGPERPPRPAFA